MEYEVVIGLEVHAQLSTKSKIFCGSSAAFGGETNEYVDPLTLGMPGSLPVLNKKVVEYAIMLGLAMNCEIRNFNRFARKHYFYPDLPKGYQISQFEEPICERGHIDIRLDEKIRTIGIKRIHMEEDAGKNIHDSRTAASLIDLNRAGVPLLEIVSEPDIRTPSEAGAYMKAVRQLIRWLEIGDGNMEEGSLRCDANISLREIGSLKFGTRTEIKNLNSFKFVEKALEYEIARQMSILKAGNKVIQETMLFDSVSGTTRSLRSKEESSDYRYFPDPDLPPLVVEESWIAEIQSKMPKLPDDKFKEFVEGYGLTPYDAGVLTSEKDFVAYFQEVFDVCSNAKVACNWITSELFGSLKKAGMDISSSPISAKNLGSLINLVTDETISGKMAKTVFEEMFNTRKTPEEIVASSGLKQITNDDEISKIVLGVLQKFTAQRDEYVGGNDRLHGFFVGQVIKASAGNANPAKVNEIITREIQNLRKK